jgi:hypothetical protein
MRMTPEFAAALVRYQAAKFGGDMARTAAIRRAILADCFQQQRDFIADPDPTKTLVCGRRGGKTTTMAMDLFLAAIDCENAFSVYIGNTRKNAKLLIWPEMKRISRRYGIDGKVNNSDLTITIPWNNHVIFLGGADTERDIEKFRSFKYKKAAVDECGSLPDYLRKLVEDILEPATIDVDGSITLGGTPGPVCDGYFHELTNNPDSEDYIAPHHWTCLENPYIPNARGWLAARKKKRGWDDRHPTYLREWMGIWVPDHTALVYQYNAARNGWDGQLPDLHGQSAWTYTLGVDYGYSPDATGICLVADARTCPSVFVAHAEKMIEATPSAVAARIDELRQRFNIVRIVLDVGAKGIIDEWRQRFRLPVTAPIDKHAKREHISLVNDALEAGRLKIKKDLPLIHELNTVVWDEKRRKPDDRNPNDIADGFEYAFMASYYFAAKEPTKPTSELTPEERIQREEEQYERRAVKRVRRERRARDLGL